MTNAPLDPELVVAVEGAVMARGGRRVGAEVRFLCPAHDDTTPSADFSPAKGAWICRVCSASGGLVDLAGRLGVELPSRPRARARRREVRYEVRDASGALVATHVRIGDGESKRLWWERDGTKGLGGLEVKDLPLYGAHDLRDVPQAATVTIIEGEKARDALVARGVPAVATVCGAAVTPSSAVLEVVRRFDVVLWADNDEPGQAHMTRIAARLGEIGISSRVVEWPDAPPKGDAADFRGTDDELRAQIAAARVWTPAPAIDGAGLLDEVAVLLRRFMRFSNEAQVVAVALWVAHTFAYDRFQQSPILAVTSAVMRSGKSRLLDVLELVVHQPWRVVMPSEAVVYRYIAQRHPTVLLDEVDAIFARKATEYEGLRALLNAGNRRGTVVPRVGGQGANLKVEEFDVFAPKVLAGIGTLPATVADRAIPIRLERRARRETVERFRRDDVELETEPLRERLARFMKSAALSARPPVPDVLDDRAGESWEVLLAIADAVGADWPARARRAAIELHASRDQDEEAMSLVLLRDIRDAFAERGAGRLASGDLLEHLLGLEASPWAEYLGKPLTKHGLSKLLRPYRIGPRNVRIGADVRKGYLLEQFADTFDRYLPALSHDPSRASESATSLQPRQVGPISVADADALQDVADLDATRSATSLDRRWDAGTATSQPPLQRGRVSVADSGPCSDVADSEAPQESGDNSWRANAVAEVATWPTQHVLELLRLEEAGMAEREALERVRQQVRA